MGDRSFMVGLAGLRLSNSFLVELRRSVGLHAQDSALDNLSDY